MKLIEALKKQKDLRRKVTDLVEKIGKHSADLDIENPVYPDTKAQVDGWLQAVRDLTLEIERLNRCVQFTNLRTEVAIELEGKAVAKPLCDWVLRRRELAKLELAAWRALTDRSLPATQVLKQSTGEQREIKIRRYYDPALKDKKVDSLQSEPLIIDGRLEVVNATTDLIED